MGVHFARNGLASFQESFSLPARMVEQISWTPAYPTCFTVARRETRFSPQRKQVLVRTALPKESDHSAQWSEIFSESHIAESTCTNTALQGRKSSFTKGAETSVYLRGAYIPGLELRSCSVDAIGVAEFVVDTIQPLRGRRTAAEHWPLGSNVRISLEFGPEQRLRQPALV